MTPHIVVATLAGVSSLALAITGLLLGRPGWIRRSFTFGMVMFGVESFATAMLLGGAEPSRTPIAWLDIVEAARLAAPLAWVVFTGALARHHAAALPPLWRMGLTAGTTLALGVFTAVVTLGGYNLSFASGRFELASLTG